MSQHEREKCARDRRLASKLDDIATELRASRCLVEAAEMAAKSLEKDERDPLVELLAIVSGRLKAISADIVAQIGQQASTDAA